jgi:hypothetical protein
MIVIKIRYAPQHHWCTFLLGKSIVLKRHFQKTFSGGGGAHVMFWPAPKPTCNPYRTLIQILNHLQTHSKPDLKLNLNLN